MKHVFDNTDDYIYIQGQNQELKLRTLDQSQI